MLMVASPTLRSHYTYGLLWLFQQQIKARLRIGEGDAWMPKSSLDGIIPLRLSGSSSQ